MPNKFKSNFTFGNVIAESDHLLADAYWDNGDFATIESYEDKRCFIIGRTGSGKSATFQHLIEKCPDKVVRIDPESLSLPYILNISVIHQLMNAGVHLETFMKTLWKHVIVVEILRHRYQINTPEQKQNILNFLMERLKREPGKAEAIKYLEEFGDKFWCETDERVRQIADTLVQKLNATGSLSASLLNAGAKSSGSIEETLTQETKQEITNKFQKIVNEMQLPRLNQMIVILNNTILDNRQNFTYLIIDDLDKQWVNDELAILLIRCLFQAVVDLQQVKYLKILVALRTNIFQQLNYDKQSRGGQEEKFRGLALDIRWTENDLQNLMSTRAEAASRYYKIDPPLTLKDMLPNPGKRPDKTPLSYILSRTLMRPRDAILYLNTCTREATGREKITWDNIYHAEKAYSNERLLALRDEWKDPYLGIDKVFEKFYHKSAKLSNTEITEILEDIALLIGDRNFLGKQWLETMCEPMYAATSVQKTWEEIYGTLIKLLYNVGFIGITKGPHGRPVFAYDDPGLTQINGNLSPNIYFEIHPAFRQALNIVDNHSSP
jgi:hypothetical protein